MAAFQTPEQFREIVYAFQQSRIILSAYELELFTAMDAGNQASEQIAASAGSNPRATDRLLNALVAIGLVEKKQGLFSNGAFAQKYLNKKSPDYLSGYGHTLNMWNTWTGLTEAVKTGKCKVRKEKNKVGWTHNFIAAMHERARLQADNVVKKIPVNTVGNVLDIGGGSGAYTIALLKHHKALWATIFDLPEVLVQTKEYVERAGFTDRIRFLAGDYHEDNFGEGYDLIFLSAIVHINSFDENRLLIAKCARALNPGGQVVIQDHVMDVDRTTPVNGAFFALNMLVATEKGDTYTEEEIKTWMEQAGLSNFQTIPTLNNAMIIGTKES